MAKMKLKVSVWLSAFLTVTGLFSMKVIKLAWKGNMSKLPWLFLEDTQKALELKIIPLGEIMRTCKSGLNSSFMVQLTVL